MYTDIALSSFKFKGKNEPTTWTNDMNGHCLLINIRFVNFKIYLPLLNSGKKFRMVTYKF